MKHIYTAPNKQAAEAALRDFAEKYHIHLTSDRTYPKPHIHCAADCP